MKGLFCNIRGLGLTGRIQALGSRIRENHADFVGISETKKRDYPTNTLRALFGNVRFD
jgi:hypothetical protein